MRAVAGPHGRQRGRPAPCLFPGKAPLCPRGAKQKLGRSTPPPHPFTPSPCLIRVSPHQTSPEKGRSPRRVRSRCPVALHSLELEAGLSQPVETVAAPVASQLTAWTSQRDALCILSRGADGTLPTPGSSHSAAQRGRRDLVPCCCSRLQSTQQCLLQCSAPARQAG